MEKVVTGLLVLVGIIHLLPVSGVLGVERLSGLRPPPAPLSGRRLVSR